MADTAPAAAPSSCLLGNYNRAAVRFVRGEGCWLIDDAGTRYIDAFAGVAVSTLGHGHPALVSAISHQAATLIHVSNYYASPQQEQLAARLVAHSFPGRVLFCNSGTESNEAAYKAARAWSNIVHDGRKPRIISFAGGFHGRTIGAVSVTANPKYREPFAPLPQPLTEFLPFGDVAAFNAAMADNVCAVWIEPVQGEGGVMVAPPGFLAAVRAACTRHGALMVVDEVQTGISRSGKPFAYQYDGATPDIMCLAKGLGGGVPIGATMFGPSAWDLLKPGMHGTTFGGNPLAMAAGLAVTELAFTPDFLTHVNARSEQLITGLRRVFAGQEVRGRGLLLGVQLDADPTAMVAAARAHGAIVGPAGNNTLRLAPPLIISAAEIDELLTRLGAARRQVTGAA